MGNSRFKRVLAIVLAATCLLTFSFSASFASTASPQSGKVKGSSDSWYTCNVKSKTATMLYLYKKSIKTKKIPSTVSKDGVKCKITTIKSNAFKGAKKLKTIKIQDKYLKKVQKNAFKGATKLKTIKIYKSKVGGKKAANKIKKLIKKGLTTKQKKTVKIKIV